MVGPVESASASASSSARRAASRGAAIRSPGTSWLIEPSHVPLWLAPSGPVTPARSSTKAVLGYLADRQLADGGLEPGWSRSRLHTIFRARLAVCTAEPHDRRAAGVAERIERS